MTRTIPATFADGTNTGTYWSHMDVDNTTTLHQFINYLQSYSESHYDHFNFALTTIYLLLEMGEDMNI
jgi:hypothetical protein